MKMAKARRRWMTLPVALCLSIGVSAAAAPERTIDWADLRPPAAAEDNPFAKMTDAQLEALRQVVLDRLMRQRGLQVSDALERATAERVAQLAAQGIDADAVLAQRDALIARRRATDDTGVAALDGQAIRLGGYLLPAELKDNQVIEFLLVPWVGACSHTPPPPANQSVRVRPAQPYALSRTYEPVWVSGVLRLRPQEKSVFVVDGEMAVRSVYAIDDAAVFSARPRAAGPAAAPAER
jgi:hypothetical protein